MAFPVSLTQHNYLFKAPVTLPSSSLPAISPDDNSESRNASKILTAWPADSSSDSALDSAPDSAPTNGIEIENISSSNASSLSPDDPASLKSHPGY